MHAEYRVRKWSLFFFAVSKSTKPDLPATKGAFIMNKNQDIVNQKQVFSIFVGIDLAKHHCAIHVIDNQKHKKTTIQSCPTSNLLNKIELLELDKSKTVIAIEACGQSNYHAQCFIAKGYEVKIIDANAVATLRGNSAKTDSNDAVLIATLAQIPDLKTVSVRAFHSQFDASLISIKHEISKQRSRLLQKLNAQAREYGFSSLRALCKHLCSLGIRDNLVIKHAGINRYLDTKEHINTNVILSPVFLQYISLSLAMLYDFDKSLKEFNEIQDRALNELLLAKDELEIEQIKTKKETIEELATIPGVGKELASSLVNKVDNNFNKFSSENKLMSYLGLTSRSYNTANKVGAIGIKGIGCCIVKNNVYQAALSVYKQLVHTKSWKCYKLKEKSHFKNTILDIARQIIKQCYIKMGGNKSTLDIPLLLGDLD